MKNRFLVSSPIRDKDCINITFKVNHAQPSNKVGRATCANAMYPNRMFSCSVL